MAARKFLHAADIHLDSPLQKLTQYEAAPVEEIRGASRHALAAMVDLAIEEQVDLVVIAGDLYDGDWPHQGTGLCFVKQAARLIEHGIPVFVIRGNHDAENLMTSSLPLPKNPDGSDILLRSDTVDQRRLDDLGFMVHGQSFRTRSETSNLAENYPTPTPGMCNIGLLHTSLTGAEGHEPYAPCTASLLHEKEYDYWALGHVHTRFDHRIDDSCPIVFPGNVQGRHIRETGPKGCLIVEVDEQNVCTPRFHVLDRVRWELLPIAVDTIQHPDDVIDRFRDALPQTLASAGERLLVVRVDLVGTTSCFDALHQKRDDLRAALQATAIAVAGDRVWLENVTLRTLRTGGRDSLAEDLDGPLSSLDQVVQRVLTDHDARKEMLAELALLKKKLPAEAVRGEAWLASPDEDAVRELIESAFAEVAGRLRTPTEGN
ncbi:MAG: DNA repair exonuclease [Planctomycetota bacterium]